MKKLTKRILTFALACAMLFTTELFVPQNTTEVQAASTPRFTDKSYVVTYQPGEYFTRYYTLLSIVGCNRATEIKNVKSSNTSVCRLQVKQGYLRAFYYKTGTATITCKVKGKKISTKLIVKKYASPVKSFKIGRKEFASKFKATANHEYFHTDKIKKQKLNIVMNKNWVMTGIYTSLNGTSKSNYRLGAKTKYSAKISSSGAYDHIRINCTNKKTGIVETIELDLSYE